MRFDADGSLARGGHGVRACRGRGRCAGRCQYGCVCQNRRRSGKQCEESGQGECQYHAEVDCHSEWIGVGHCMTPCLGRDCRTVPARKALYGCGEQLTPLQRGLASANIPISAERYTNIGISFDESSLGGGTSGLRSSDCSLVGSYGPLRSDSTASVCGHVSQCRTESRTETDCSNIGIILA